MAEGKVFRVDLRAWLSSDDSSHYSEMCAKLGEQARNRMEAAFLDPSISSWPKFWKPSPWARGREEFR